METAIEQLRTVPETEQDWLASLVLNELERGHSLTAPMAASPTAVSSTVGWLTATRSEPTEEDVIVAGSIAAISATLPPEDFRDWEK